jgi:hypothetical protein
MDPSLAFREKILLIDEHIRQLKIQRAALEKSVEFSNSNQDPNMKVVMAKFWSGGHILYFAAYYPLDFPDNPDLWTESPSQSESNTIALSTSKTFTSTAEDNFMSEPTTHPPSTSDGPKPSAAAHSPRSKTTVDPLKEENHNKTVRPSTI